MAYTKTTWKDRVVQNPNTYTETTNADGTKTLTPAEGTITEPGTPLSAANLNNIEAGVQAASDHIDNKNNPHNVTLAQIGAEPSFSKKTAFNKDFGTTTGTVADGGVVATHTADDVSHVKYGVATGTANTYSVTLSPAPTAYADGIAVSVKINVNATAASTLNVNGLGAKPIKKANGNDVTNLKANGVYTLRYNSATGNFILQGEGGSGNATASDLLSGKTASTDAGDIVGIMPDNGSLGTITPGTANIAIPAGHTSGGTVVGDPDFIAANIKKGVTIFDVVGTLIDGTNMKKWASGNITPVGNVATVSGLDFLPSTIIISAQFDYPNQASYEQTIYSVNTIADGTNTMCLKVKYNSTSFQTVDGSTYYVNNGVFRLPTVNNYNNKWTAFE